VWRVSIDGQSLAIRQFREEQQRVIATEVEALRLAGNGGIPVPSVLSTGSVNGRYPAMALEWLPGNSAAEVMLRQPNLAKRLGRSAGRLLARIHRLPVRKVSAIGNLDIAWFERDDSIDTATVDRIKQITPVRSSLLHLDFHPNNIMAIGGRITGVLDWTNAAIGDPRLDVARAVSILRVVAPAIVARRGARRMSLARFTRALLQGYQANAGPLHNMAPFYAWAGGMLIADLTPKIDQFPVEDPDAPIRTIRTWTEHWRTSALQE
jgi:aminoglycoside phosphotransferase (APT) family kinase protein